MRKKDRDTETLNLSFLDVICCGFGAIILLLVLTKIFEPIRLEESHAELEELITRYQEELNDLRGETEIVERERISTCLLYTSPSPRDGLLSRMPSSA